MTKSDLNEKEAEVLRLKQEMASLYLKIKRASRKSWDPVVEGGKS